MFMQKHIECLTKEILIFTITFSDNCGINCAIYHDNAFAWEYPGIGRRTTFMSLEGLVLFALIFFIESGIWRKLLNNSYADLTSGDEWSDIEMGRLKICVLLNMYFEKTISVFLQNIMYIFLPIKVNNIFL